MKCREVKLYSFRPRTSWPADLVGHLQQCDKCRRLQTKLKKIDEEVYKLATPTRDLGGKAKLLDLIKDAPQAPARSEPVSRRPWIWLRRGAFGAAAAALIAFGWFLGHRSEPIETIRTVEVFRDKINTVEVFRDKIVRVESPAERQLFASLIKRNALLVQALQTTDRLDTLLDMANDCRQHALTLIEHGPREHLPLAINLYAKLLREGVLAQLERVPPDDRGELAKTVRVVPQANRGVVAPRQAFLAIGG